MKNQIYMKLIAIKSDNTLDFETQFNNALEQIEDANPVITQDLSNGFSATILYKVEKQILESIGDEFRLAGIRHICRECPFHDIETNKAVKWVTCDYAESGETHLDHECCEFFYKMLKNGEIKPGDPCRSVKKNGRHRTW